jgi:hypothetical protein
MISELWRPLLVFGTFIVIVVAIIVLLFLSGGGDGGATADNGDDAPAAEQSEPEDEPADEPADEDENKGGGESISAKDLEVGDCITGANSTQGDVIRFNKVECSKPHDGEVFTLIELKDTDKYPGVKFVSGKGQRGCRARLRRQATAKAFRDRQLGYKFVYPTRQSWAQNDREVTCLATFKKSRTGELEQRAGADDA